MSKNIITGIAVVAVLAAAYLGYSLYDLNAQLKQSGVTLPKK